MIADGAVTGARRAANTTAVRVVAVLVRYTLGPAGQPDDRIGGDVVMLRTVTRTICARYLVGGGDVDTGR